MTEKLNPLRSPKTKPMSMAISPAGTIHRTVDRGRRSHGIHHDADADDEGRRSR